MRDWERDEKKKSKKFVFYFNLKEISLFAYSKSE